MKASACQTLDSVVYPAQLAMGEVLMLEKENIPLKGEHALALIAEAKQNLKRATGEWIYKCDTHPDDRYGRTDEFYYKLVDKSQYAQDFK